MGFSLSGDKKYPKSFIFLPLSLACVVMLMNNLLSSLLNFSCWTSDASVELGGH